MLGVASWVARGRWVAPDVPQLWAKGAIHKPGAAKSGGGSRLSASIRPQNRMPAAPLCRRKNFQDRLLRAVDDRCRSATTGILIAWKDSADGGRVHQWEPTLRFSPKSFHQQEGSMTKYKLEYIWLDGYTPTPS